MFIKSLKLCWLYCLYRDNIEYRDNFLDDNRDMIFSISPNSSRNMMLTEWATYIYLERDILSRTEQKLKPCVGYNLVYKYLVM